MKLGSEDIEALKKLRGVFSDEKKALYSAYSYSALFIVLSIFFLILTAREGIPQNTDEWTVAALIPLSLGLSFFLWLHADVKYEFSDSGITALRRKKRIREISFESINGGRINQGRHGIVRIELQSDRKKFSCLLYKSIQTELQKLKTEPVVIANT